MSGENMIEYWQKETKLNNPIFIEREIKEKLEMIAAIEITEQEPLVTYSKIEELK